jgi:hypothetical protein
VNTWADGAAADRASRSGECKAAAGPHSSGLNLVSSLTSMVAYALQRRVTCDVCNKTIRCATSDMLSARTWEAV